MKSKNSSAFSSQSSRYRINPYLLCKMSLCVAIICVGAYIAVPLPNLGVITLQTAAVNIIALLLTPRQSFITLLTYILLGAVGLPVFAGMKGGLSVLIGPTGGFIIGFLLAAPFISLLKGKRPSLLRYCIVTVGIGMPTIYLFGVVMFCLLTQNSVWPALTMCVLPYIPLDLVKCVLGSLLAVTLQRIPAVSRHTS